jgi:succinyl-CoA synthetase beta subunit
MKVHEYQARQLLAEAGVTVPQAVVVDTAEAARDAFAQLTAKTGGKVCVVKAQVHAGGRGKGGGVKLVKSADEAYEQAKRILSQPLVTPQTGPAGVKVHKLMIAQGVEIAREFYLSIVLDRAAARPMLLASSQGGMEIEQVAREKPEALVTEHLHPHTGLAPYQARNVAYKLGFKGKQVRMATKIMQQLAKLFVETDASLVEINPLIVTAASTDNPDGVVMAIDAKMTFDDNALFRHPEIAALNDPLEEAPQEIEAKQFGLSYIKLDGNIGCLVNGAGLAMATMDTIKLHGGEPANFLDVGGSASEEAVTQAFKIILEDEHVKGVLVNIFGGIMQCDVIARAIVSAAQHVGFKVPLVVRLEGTNVEPARKILDAAKGDIPMLRSAADLTDAAKQVTAAVKSAA